MNEEINIDDFKEAGKIAGKVRKESIKLVMPGASVLDIAETLEQMIIEEGAIPAFPANISCNSVAAHYTPEHETDRVLGDEDVVKIDVGAAVNDGIGDTAHTIDLSGKHENLVKSTKEALDAAIAMAKPGVKVGDIGAVIEEKIKSYGFKPVSNLSGHMILPGVLHAGVNIPNVKTSDPYQLQEGEIFAIEPFASSGSGFVSDMDEVEIFSLYSLNPVKMRQSRQILNHVVQERRLLPFAERWLNKKFNSRLTVSAALKEMLREHIIQGYPPLKDSEGGLVSQAEHTILITSNGAEILTK